MFVRMLENREPTLEGTGSVRLRQGEIHDVPDELAHRWIARGVAEPVEVDRPSSRPARARKRTRGR